MRMPEVAAASFNLPGIKSRKPPAPGIEKGWMDTAFPTTGGDVHTAGRLAIGDGPPMGTPIFCCHLLPPDDEDFHCREA